MTSRQLTIALTKAFDSALASGDIGRLTAVERIVEIEDYQGVDGLVRTIVNDPTDWLMVAAPGFSVWLKIATGKDRAAWLSWVS